MTGDLPDLKQLTHSFCAENCPTKFVIRNAGFNAIELELHDVSDLKRTGSQEIYSLVFRGPVEPVLGQSIYELEHPVLGRSQLFLVAVGRGNDGQVKYEAVFNHVL